MFCAIEIQSHNALSSWNILHEAVLNANGNDGFVFTTNDNKAVIKKPANKKTQLELKTKASKYNSSTIRKVLTFFDRCE